MYLVYHQINPPKQFNHDPTLKNIYGFTVQDYIQSHKLKLTNQWKTIDCGIENKRVIRCLSTYCETYDDNKINKDIIINNPSWQDNRDKMTFAMFVIFYGIIPPKQFIHEPNIKGGWGNETVREYLQDKNLPIPNEWYDDEYKKDHEYKPKCINDAFYGILTERDENIDPNQQYEKRWTVAMIYASQGIIPPYSWNHDPLLKDVYKNTVAMLLIENKISVPEQWQYNPELKNYGECTTAMYLANNQLIPPKEWEHRPDLQDKYGYTVAMYLAKNEINVPEQWYHNPQLQKNNGETVALILAKNSIIPPKEWEHNPELKDNDNNTVSLNLAKNSIISPVQWYHDPSLTDKQGKTVEYYLLINNIEVPNQWKINKQQIEITDEIKQQLKFYCEIHNIRNQQLIINYPQYQKYFGINTFPIYLELHDIQVPKELQYDPNYKLLNGMTTAMEIAYQGKIPSEYWNHDSIIQDNYGLTVAYYLEKNKIQTPKQWQFDPEYKLKDNNTTAIQIARYGIIPSQYWHHDPIIQNDDGCTVAIYLSQKGIIPPKQWMHDVDIKNNQNESIRSNLLRYDYYYINNKFIKLNKDTIKQCIQTETLDDICQICLNEGKQYFIISNCTHKICLQCFKELFKNKNYQRCQVCRQEQWFKTNEQTQ